MDYGDYVLCRFVVCSRQNLFIPVLLEEPGGGVS